MDRKTSRRLFLQQGSVVAAAGVSTFCGFQPARGGEAGKSVESKEAGESPGTMEYTRRIPMTQAYDVVVCGGGPSGCAAALAARREGLSVLLLERQSQLGGTATSGLVSHWLGGRTQEGDWVVRGLFQSLVEEAAARGYAKIPHLTAGRLYQPHAWLPWFVHGIPLDPFGMAHFLDEKVQAAGIDVLYETHAMDVRVEGDRITHILIHNKSGLEAVPAAAAIDATGDADIAALSGCEFQLGRESDGLMTPASLIFHLDHVDHEQLGDYIEAHKSPKLREKIRELREAGQWPFPVDIFISVELVEADAAMINMVRLPGVNGVDASSRTQGLIHGRAEAFQMADALRKHFPGFENAKMKCVASMLGVRESRRITGDFCLRVEHLKESAAFDDTIGFSMYGWDLPDPKNPNLQPLVDFSGGKYVTKVEKSLSTPIPYRIMVPRPVTNLLCPGRAVSVERDVLGPLRVMAPCMAMGEACGVAAGQIVHDRLAAAAVDIARLKARLREVGALLDHAALPAISPRVDP